MIRQFRRLNFHEISFDVLNDSIPNAIGQKIDNCGMNFRRGGKRPTFFSAAVDDFCDLVGQLLVNTTVGFVFEFCFCNRRCAALRASVFARREPPCLVCDFVE